MLTEVSVMSTLRPLPTYLCQHDSCFRDIQRRGDSSSKSTCVYKNTQDTARCCLLYYMVFHNFHFLIPRNSANITLSLCPPDGFKNGTHMPHCFCGDLELYRKEETRECFTCSGKNKAPHVLLLWSSEQARVGIHRGCVSTGRPLLSAGGSGLPCLLGAPVL